MGCMPKSNFPAARLLRSLLFEDPRPFVLYDLEYTSWEGAMERGWSGPGEFREIVAFGAVRLSPRPDPDFKVLLEEAEVFDVLAVPTINPVLSDYFAVLTGIRNEDVEFRGVPLQAALDAFGVFLGGDPAFSWGGDDKTIAENLSRSGLRFDRMDAFHDIRPILLSALDLPEETNSGSVARRLGIRLEGKGEHDALFDARSIAAGLARAAASGRL